MISRLAARQAGEIIPSTPPPPARSWDGTPRHALVVTQGREEMLIKLATGQIYYDLTGPENGQVVCFTHSLASDGGMWAEQLPPLLAAGYRVLRLDMRGHGGSDTVQGPYTMSALAGDVAAAIDALGLDRVHFVGLSIGGMIGQGFAIEHGARLKSLMLCDT